jgi:hypothetical protein
MEKFGKAQRDWLKGLPELPNGIPSHDTFGRVFAALDPAQFAEAFTAWTQSLRESLAGEIVAVPELLRRLELAGCTLRLRSGPPSRRWAALKTIAREIHGADADDVLALKANHEVLHGEIQTFLDDALDHPAHLPEASRHRTLEKDRGRIETRRYLCTGKLDWLADRGRWAALRSVAGSPVRRPP